MALSRGRKLLFACAAVLLATLSVAGTLVAADLYAHHRLARTQGLNVWGYRGPVMSGKRPGEVRIAFLGGSTMFGYGVGWDEAIPAVVERELQRSLAGSPPVTTANLGYNNEGAYSFLFTLKDYAYLNYDVAVLYEGYNDMMGDPDNPNTAVFRHDSAVFRLTGYSPMLPLMLHEKAMALRAGGDIGAAYAAEADGKTMFRASLAQRTSAAALDAAAQVSASLAKQLRRLSDAPPKHVVPTHAGCAFPWAEYCESVYVAVSHARAAGKRVVVVSQPRVLPPLADRHAAQQAALREMIGRHFSADQGVIYVDLSGAVDLSDRALCYDAMHLTAEGNAKVGAALARALASVVRSAAPHS